MNYTNTLKEKVLKVVVNTESFYVFSRYFGDTVMDAQTLTNSAIRGTEPALLPVHEAKTGASREGEIVYINAYHITKATVEMLDVPDSVIAKYKSPDGESEEEKEVRLSELKNYFELR